MRTRGARVLLVADRLLLLLIAAAGAASPPAAANGGPILPAEALLRSYEASGDRTGTLGLTFIVLRYASADQAARGLPQVAQFIEEGAWELAVAADLRRASIAPLGDEAVAYAGEVTLEEGGQTTTFTLAAVVVRDGPLVHAMFGVAMVGDPLLVVVAVADGVVGRQPGAGPVVVGQDGLRRGDLWDVLPRLEDLPTGFMLAAEQALTPEQLFRPYGAGPTPTPAATPAQVLPLPTAAPAGG